MWSFDSFKISLDIVSWVIKSKDSTPFKSRKNAKNTTRKFYEKICPKYWINIEYKFWDETLNDYPYIVEWIKNYIFNWMEFNDFPLLWLGNHQAGSIEAVWAYDFFPLDWRIVLKDDLIKPPFFWDAIKSIDPIVHYRNNKDSEKIRYNEINNQILNNKAVLIFPEGTRSKNWKLWNFKSSLYKPAFDTIKENKDQISQILAVVTVDSFDVFPDTLEKSMLFMWEVKPWTITYTIDIVDISLYETVKDVNKKVRNTIQFNLDNKNNSI